MYSGLVLVKSGKYTAIVSYPSAFHLLSRNKFICRNQILLPVGQQGLTYYVIQMWNVQFKRDANSLDLFQKLVLTILSNFFN